MTEAEVWDNLTLFTEAASVPVLSDADIDTLVGQAKRADSSGRAPTDVAWVPTWNVAFAVALGWQIKLGRLVSAYDFASADQRLQRSQMFKHCQEMVTFWKEQGSSLVGGGAVSGIGTIQLRGLPTRPPGSADPGSAPGELLSWWQIENRRETDAEPPY